MPTPWKLAIKRGPNHVAENDKNSTKISTKSIYSNMLKKILPPTAESKSIRYGFTQDGTVAVQYKVSQYQKNVRYSKDPVITNYPVNNKNIRYSGGTKLNNGIYNTQNSPQTCV